MVSKKLLIVCQPPSAHDYWTDMILRGIRQEAARQELAMCVYESVRALAEAENGPGCVLLIGHSNQWFDVTSYMLKQTQIQPVIVSGFTPLDAHYNAAYFSLTSCMEEVLIYLCDADRRRIALLGYNPDSPADVAKVRAFTRLTGEMGLDGCRKIACQGITLKACVDRFVEDADNFDAVICANDTVAISAIQSLTERGFRVPEDLFVIGIGNMRVSSAFKMQITSISFNYTELGRQAVALYLQCLKERSGVHRHVILPCRMVVRGSTAYFNPPDESLVQPEPDPDELNAYYADPDACFLNNIEEMLQRCDEWDERILQGLLRGKTYQQMADDLHFTERTIKYRVKKLVSQAGQTTRRGLCELLGQYIDQTQSKDAEGDWT